MEAAPHLDFPSRSSRAMTMTTPAGPTFFCAPAKITPYLETSTGFEQKFEDMSATSNVSPTSGGALNSTPCNMSKAGENVSPVKVVGHLMTDSEHRDGRHIANMLLCCCESWLCLT